MTTNLIDTIKDMNIMNTAQLLMSNQNTEMTGTMCAGKKTNTPTMNGATPLLIIIIITTQLTEPTQKESATTIPLTGSCFTLLVVDDYS